MAVIPTYQEKVGLSAGGTPTPQVAGPMQSAAGLDVAQSLEGLGKTVAAGAEHMASLVAYKQRLDAQQKVDDLSEKASAEWQNHLHGEGGLLNRQGDAAKGITAGGDFTGTTQPGTPQEAQQKNGIKYKDSFDGFSSTLKEKYMSQATTDYERRALNHALNSHERVLRNTVIAHEGQQSKIARESASEAAVQAFKNTALDASTAGDFQHALDQGIDKREQSLRAEGHTDETVISAVKMKTVDEFAEAAVRANLDSDPESAQSFLDEAKGRGMSGGMRQHLQDQIDGKMVSIRSEHLSNDAISNPDNKLKNMKLDISKVEAQVREAGKERPEAELQHFVKYAAQEARAYNANLEVQKQQDTRDVLDAYTKARDSINQKTGQKYTKGEADNIIMGKYAKTFGLSEMETLREHGDLVYARDPASIKNRLKAMNDDQIGGYGAAQDIIKTKFALKSKALLEGDAYKMTPGRVLLRQLDNVAPTMGGKQMVEWVNAQLKDVPQHKAWLTIMGHKFFEGGIPAWQVQHRQEMGNK